MTEQMQEQAQRKPQATYTCQDCGKEFKDNWDARTRFCPLCMGSHKRVGASRAGAKSRGKPKPARVK